MNKTIRSGVREVIYKVFMRCLVEFQAGKLLTDLDDVYKRTVDMTGKSESTVRRIVVEGSKNKGKFSTPAKHRKGRPKKILDDFDKCKFCKIKKTEKTYYERGQIMYNNIDELIINVGEDSSSEFEDESEDEKEENMSGVEYLDFDILEEDLM